MADLRRLLILLPALLLASCESDSGFSIPPQTWHDFDIVLETRPTPVRPGMNEFLVMATSRRGLPVSDLVISLRVSAQNPWHQAIQDGHSGVYRTALSLQAGDTHILMQVRQKKTETVLQYSLLPPVRIGNPPANGG